MYQKKLSVHGGHVIYLPLSVLYFGVAPPLDIPCVWC